MIVGGVSPLCISGGLCQRLWEGLVLPGISGGLCQRLWEGLVPPGISGGLCQKIVGGVSPAWYFRWVMSVIVVVG